MDDNPDVLRTLSVKEAYELYQRVYGPSPMTTFYAWRNKRRIQPAPSSTLHHPRYFRHQIERVTGPIPETL